MTAARSIDTLLPSQDLPVELLRLTSSVHPSEEPRVASMLSGLVAARQQDDEVICPLMLQRNLVIPAHQGSITRSAWRID